MNDLKPFSKYEYTLDLIQNKEAEQNLVSSFS